MKPTNELAVTDEQILAMGYKKSHVLDIHKKPVFEGSIINADGYESDISENEFYCVEHNEDGSFTSCIYGDSDNIHSYQKIEVLGHVEDYRHLIDEEWSGNFGAALKTTRTPPAPVVAEERDYSDMQWFAYDPDDGITFHATAELARDKAANSVERSQDSAADGYGFGEVEDVAWGKVYGEAALKWERQREEVTIDPDSGEDEHGCTWEDDWAFMAEYELRDITTHPAGTETPVDRGLWHDLKSEKPKENHVTRNGLSLQCVVVFSGYTSSVFSGLYDHRTSFWRVVDASGSLTEGSIHNSSGDTMWCYTSEFKAATPHEPLPAQSPEAGEDAKEICFWDVPDDDWPTSGCGTEFQFNDDGPVENGFKFCPFCGKTLEIEAEAQAYLSVEGEKGGKDSG